MRDLKKVESWHLAAESVSGLMTYLRVRMHSISGRVLSCRINGLGEGLMGLGEGGAGVADRDGHEFHLSPKGL
jgi:hypothetical protein